MKSVLFDAGERRARHGGTKALVPLDLTACPECGRPVNEETVHEDALLRHGGFGATRSSTYLHCYCGWTLLRRRSETRPPRAAA